MDISGISLNAYIILLFVSIFIGWITNRSKIFGNFLINAGMLTLFFLFQRVITTLQLEANPYTGWMVHPIATIIMVGYGIGTFGGRVIMLLMKLFG